MVQANWNYQNIRFFLTEIIGFRLIAGLNDW